MKQKQNGLLTKERQDHLLDVRVAKKNLYASIKTVYKTKIVNNNRSSSVLFYKIILTNYFKTFRDNSLSHTKLQLNHIQFLFSDTNNDSCFASNHHQIRK